MLPLTSANAPSQRSVHSAICLQMHSNTISADSNETQMYRNLGKNSTAPPYFLMSASLSKYIVETIGKLGQNSLEVHGSTTGAEGSKYGVMATSEI